MWRGNDTTTSKEAGDYYVKKSTRVVVSVTLRTALQFNPQKTFSKKYHVPADNNNNERRRCRRKWTSSAHTRPFGRVAKSVLGAAHKTSSRFTSSTGSSTAPTPPHWCLMIFYCFQQETADTTTSCGYAAALLF